MSERIVALVPMRHKSERVPGKNFRSFGGRPLYHQVVGTLLSCPSVQRVVIDTDSPIIQADAAECFPEVTVLERAEHLRGETVSMNEVLLHIVDRIPSDFYLQTHATNPLLRSETVERAVQTFLGAIPEHDSLFSVTRRQTRFWTPEGVPVNHDPAVLLRTQDLPPYLEENSCLYLFSGEDLRQLRNRIGRRPLLFEMDPLEAFDIDEESDFVVAEILFHQRQGESELWMSGP